MALRALVLLGLFAWQDPVIRLDVQQVLVPVVVTDKKGHHVSGLKAPDFRILEDGVPQEIAAFSTDTSTAAEGPRRTFVICVDTLHTAPGNAAHMREALETLFEKEKPSDAQYVLIGIGRQMQVLQPATTNPLEILLKIRSTAFQGLMSGFDSSAFAAQLQNLRIRMDDFCRRCACGTRARQTCEPQIDALKQSVDADAARWIAPTDGMLAQFAGVVAELAKLPTSRSLILVSDGFSTNPKRDFYAAVSSYLPNSPQFKFDDAGDSLGEALKVANDRNVTIYTIDTRGGATPSLASIGPMDAGSSQKKGAVTSMDGISNAQHGMAGIPDDVRPQTAPPSFEESPSMQQLARSTGGTYFHGAFPGASDLLKDFRSAIADGRESYVLAYVPKNNAHDGKFRQITVQTARGDLTIRAKSGYWANAATGQ